jgi:hypothetical protein
MDLFSFHEYYRLLNCGYRVPLVGGTDKMSAGMPVGNVRTYAHVGDDALSFDRWAQAVRSGCTYSTSGPLIELLVEGHRPGHVLEMSSTGGTVHVTVEAQAVTAPLHRLELLLNGRVIAHSSSGDGARQLKIDEMIRLDGPGWLAARCSGNDVIWSIWPQHPIAHTSPVYITTENRRLWDAQTGEYLITTMEGGIAWLDTLATHNSPERQAEIRRVFEDAIVAVRNQQRSAS